MIKESINVQGVLNQRIRGICKFDDKFMLTQFPEKIIYITDNQGNILEKIDTEFFYGSISYDHESKSFVCGCYSSCKTELHILNLDFEIVKVIDYVTPYPMDIYEGEQYLSFCTTAFLFNKNIYFSFQNSSTLYCIKENKKIIKIKAYSQLVNGKSKIISYVLNGRNFVCLIKTIDTTYLIKYDLLNNIIFSVKKIDLELEEELWFLHLNNF